MAEAGNNSLRVRLVTPERILVDSTADAVEIPASTGCIEVLTGHAPLLDELGSGLVTLHGGSHDGQSFFISHGFVEVLPERVTILAELAMSPDQIDNAVAQAELKHGEDVWQKAGDDANRYDQANVIIHEAEAKLQASSGKK